MVVERDSPNNERRAVRHHAFQGDFGWQNPTDSASCGVILRALPWPPLEPNEEAVMTLTLQLSARLQERLAAALRLGKELDEVALDVLEQHAPDNDRRLEAIGFLEH